MKINKVAQSPTFKPITLEFVFESQEELDALLAVFNYSPICDAVDLVVKNNDMPDIIRNAARIAGASDAMAFSVIRKHIEKRLSTK